MNRTRILAGIALGLAVSVAALGAAKTIKPSKLPAAVQRTAEQQSAGATVTGYSKDKAEGIVIYRMDLVAEGLARGIVMDAQGNVLSIEQELAWSDLPADIQKTFEDASRKGQLGEVSTITEDGALVAYEAYLVVNGERARVRVTPKATSDLAPLPGTTK